MDELCSCFSIKRPKMLKICPWSVYWTIVIVHLCSAMPPQLSKKFSTIKYSPQHLTDYELMMPTSKSMLTDGIVYADENPSKNNNFHHHLNRPSVLSNVKPKTFSQTTTFNNMNNNNRASVKQYSQLRPLFYTGNDDNVPSLPSRFPVSKVSESKARVNDKITPNNRKRASSSLWPSDEIHQPVSSIFPSRRQYPDFTSHMPANYLLQNIQDTDYDVLHTSELWPLEDTRHHHHYMSEYQPMTSGFHAIHDLPRFPRMFKNYHTPKYFSSHLDMSFDSDKLLSDPEISALLAGIDMETFQSLDSFKPRQSYDDSLPMDGNYDPEEAKKKESEIRAPKSIFVWPAANTGRYGTPLSFHPVHDYKMPIYTAKTASDKRKLSTYHHESQDV